MKRVRLLSLGMVAALVLSGCSSKTNEETTITEFLLVESTNETIITSAESENVSITTTESTPEETQETAYSLVATDASMKTDFEYGLLKVNDPYVKCVGSGVVASLGLSVAGPYDDVPTILSSDVTVKDFDGNVIYFNDIDSTCMPVLVFDDYNNLHVFLGDIGHTDHFAYNPEGEIIEGSEYYLNFFVYENKVMFDRNGYIYVINHDWAVDSTQYVEVYTPDGKLLASRKYGWDVSSFVKINDVPHMVVRIQDDLRLIPVLEFVQKLDYTSIVIEDASFCNNVISGNGGVYYMEYSDMGSKVRLGAYDIATNENTIIAEDISGDMCFWIDNAFIVVASYGGALGIYQ